MTQTIDTMSHLSVEDTAAFLDGRHPREVQARIEAHLATCRECRDDLGGTARLLPEVTRRRPLYRVAAGLAAAALLLIVVRTTTHRGIVPDQERAGPDLVETLILSPADDALVPADHVVLTWSAAPQQSAYRVTLTDSLGSTVWSAGSRDTSLAVSNAVTLTPGRTYYWYAEALLPDGRRRASGVHRIRIR
jgi:hypothetical protein